MYSYPQPPQSVKQPTVIQPHPQLPTISSGISNGSASWLSNPVPYINQINQQQQARQELALATRVKAEARLRKLCEDAEKADEMMKKNNAKTKALVGLGLVHAGIAAIGYGAGMAGTGIGATVVTGGVAAPISVPTAVGGVVVIAGGVVITVIGGVISILEANKISMQASSGKGEDENSSMFGSKGTQTTSKTVWKEKGSSARIDVENPNPGKRPGQVHYQDAKGNKYLYSPEKNRFVDSQGNLAPKSVNDLLKDSTFTKKLNVALEQYLGEAPYVK